MGAITLITDFGTRDGYAGAMKGVILRIAPDATIVDVTHDIERHNLIQAAFVLRQTIPWFPQGSVHVVVIDPGVGSDRRVLAGRYAGQIVIAPDNGVVSLVHRQYKPAELHAVENTRYFPGPVSATFAGRDILAPVAAHVASGLSLARLGSAAGEIETLPLPAPKRLEPFGWEGAILYTDHFGNLITNISKSHLTQLRGKSGDMRVYVGRTCIGPIRRTYCDVAVGELVALISSSEMLEISVNRGRADESLTPAPDTPVIVRSP